MEQWRQIAGYEGLYEVSDQGRIRSLTTKVPNGVGMRTRNGRVLRQSATPQGYLTVMLSKNSEMTRYTVSRLVAAAFLGAIDGVEIDHINRDRRDNRLSNLRKATGPQNKGNTGTHSTNTSGYRGVSWHKARGMWRAVISIKGKGKHLGHFDTPQEAAHRYNQAALIVFGEFASLNNV